MIKISFLKYKERRKFLLKIKNIIESKFHWNEGEMKAQIRHFIFIYLIKKSRLFLLTDLPICLKLNNK